MKKGFLKEVCFDEFVDRVHEIYLEGNLHLEKIIEAATQSFSPAMTNKELSSFLGVSERTVRNYRRRFGLIQGGKNG
jgi:hypothetical protein